jgi:hypothetical protein
MVVISLLFDIMLHAFAWVVDKARSRPKLAVGEARFDSKTGKQIK